MAITQEITRISNAKSDIKSAIEAKGVSVPSNALIDTYDDYVAQISGGGGNKMGEFVDVDPSATYSGSYDMKAFIKEAIVPEGITSFYSNFQNAKKLDSVTLPSTLTSISNYCFADCSSLTSITIPSGVTSIGNNAFDSCTSLAKVNSNINNNIVIPDTVTTLGNSAFNLKRTSYQTVHIGSGLTSMSFADGYDSFGSMPVRTWEVDPNNTKWNDGNGSGSLIETATNTLIYGSRYSTIPSGVVTIKQLAFKKHNNSLPSTIIIPDTVTTIEGYAFNLTDAATGEIHIGSGVTSIGDKAFNIGSGSTYYKVFITATTPPTLGNQVFSTVSRIYVPATSVDTYKAASGWSNYASIIAPIASEIYNFDFKAQRQTLGVDTYIPIDNTTTTPITIGSSTVNAYPCTGDNVGLYVRYDNELQLRTQTSYIGLNNRSSSSRPIYIDNLQAGDEIWLKHLVNSTTYPDISDVTNLTKKNEHNLETLYEVDANGAISISIRNVGWVDYIKVNRPTTT